MSATFAYALARLHARMAGRSTAPARKRLAAVEDFGHFLQLASRSGYGEWLRNLGPASGEHAVELALRETYRARVRELASWVPARWAESVEWLSTAPDLPVLAALLQRGQRPAWLMHDPRWSHLPAGPGEPVRSALLPDWPELAEHGDDLLQAWCARARALLPHVDRQAGARIDSLLRAQVEPAKPDRLERAFRRERSAPVRVFAFAGLDRHDFELLRGQLVRRRLLCREAA